MPPATTPVGERERQAEAGAGDHEREPGGRRGDRGGAQQAVRRHVGLRHRKRGAHEQENKAELGHGPLRSIVLLRESRCAATVQQQDCGGATTRADPLDAGAVRDGLRGPRPGARARDQRERAAGGCQPRAPRRTNQCLARPYIGVNPGRSSSSTPARTAACGGRRSTGPTGQPVGNTYVPRGSGAVTRVRIRSGDAPAPLRFAIVSSGSGLCCTTKQVSAPVQPAPNQVNQFTVNLPAGSGVGTAQGSQFNDILVVVGVGPGSLPVNDRGAHGFLFGSPANQAQASFLHPALALGESNTDVGIMDGYEVLLQYDWCGVPMTLSNPQPTPPGEPADRLPGGHAGDAPAGGPRTRRPAAPRAPLRALGALAAVRRNIATLRLRCLLDTTCAGQIRLRPRTARASGRRRQDATEARATASSRASRRRSRSSSTGRVARHCAASASSPSTPWSAPAGRAGR